MSYYKATHFQISLFCVPPQAGSREILGTEICDDTDRIELLIFFSNFACLLDNIPVEGVAICFSFWKFKNMTVS